VTRFRGPNLLPSFCQVCKARLTWRNHSHYHGRYCLTHYRERQKVRKGEVRRTKKVLPPKERTDDSRGPENV
jgi:hypothetical protein